jgi:hypothetical protein
MRLSVFLVKNHCAQQDDDDDDDDTYDGGDELHVKSTGARITLRQAIPALCMYTSRLPSDEYWNCSPRYGILVRLSVILPVVRCTAIHIDRHISHRDPIRSSSWCLSNGRTESRVPCAELSAVRFVELFISSYRE